MEQATRFSFLEIPSHVLLGAFNLWLGYAIATDPNTRVATFLAHYVADTTLINSLLASLLLLAGIAIITIAPRGRWFIVAAAPILLYNIGTITTLPAEAPNAGAVVTIFLLLYLWRSFEMDAYKQAAANYANKSHEELAAKDREIALLKAEKPGG